MFVDNPPYSVDYIKAISGEVLRPTILDLGAWDMDATEDCNIAHGLGVNWNKVRHISGFIFHDSGLELYELPYPSIDLLAFDAYIAGLTSTHITLKRRAAGKFDNVAYNDVGINRGFLCVWISD